MELKETPLNGCFIITLAPHMDQRGAFVRSFGTDAFLAAGLSTAIDHTAEASNPQRLTLRGMHYQANPFPDPKLVRCTKGAAFDVAVDVRRDSVTYGQWFGDVLEEDNHKALYLPAGFAHGYLTLRENTTLSYHLFAPYRSELQRGFRYDDPTIAIEWPFQPVLVGERDLALPLLDKGLRS
jgi:dTDP-4-dehydrorhamnose 3,5-epimerase